MLDHYDIVADAGNLTGTMKAFDITSPPSGDVTIDFTHEVENPLINGIEIVRTDESPPTSTQFDTVTDRPFDGSTAGPTSTIPNPQNIAWSQVRGAFMIGDTLFYGWSDGNFYERSFDGQTFGPATLVDPYQDPAWDNVDTGSGQTYEGMVPNLYGAEMENVSGMVYSDGKLYYSQVGQSGLDYRYFNPDDGVIGSQEFQAGGNVDFSSINGMFLSGDTLYYASAADGNLHSVAFDSGAPDATTDTVVSGPSIDGNDWRTRGMFLDTADRADGRLHAVVHRADLFLRRLRVDGSGQQHHLIRMGFRRFRHRDRAAAEPHLLITGDLHGDSHRHQRQQPDGDYQSADLGRQ